jgi:hypothetical protein
VLLPALKVLLPALKVLPPALRVLLPALRVLLPALKVLASPTGPLHEQLALSERRESKGLNLGAATTV